MEGCKEPEFVPGQSLLGIKPPTACGRALNLIVRKLISAYNGAIQGLAPPAFILDPKKGNFSQDYRRSRHGPHRQGRHGG
jgi:hypothetical protein